MNKVRGSLPPASGAEAGTGGKRDLGSLSGPGLPSARWLQRLGCRSLPSRLPPPPQTREGSRSIVLSFPVLSMSPSGSSLDDGSRKPHGAEKPELNRPRRGTPADPHFPEAYGSEGRKRCVCSADVDGFIHHPPPALAPAFSSSLSALRAMLPRAPLIRSAQRPGHERADRCLVASRQARGHCKQAADPRLSGSARKGARGVRAAAGRRGAALRALEGSHLPWSSKAPDGVGTTASLGAQPPRPRCRKRGPDSSLPPRVSGHQARWWV